MNETAAAPGEPNESSLAELVGSVVRELREKSGLSMRELAKRAGISQPFLSQIERGVSAPSMLTTYRLAAALAVTPGDLLPSPATDQVTVVRADEGVRLPVGDRPDAAIGRAIHMRPNSPLEVIEYLVEPGQFIGGWFESTGVTGVYIVSGHLDVELVGIGKIRLGPRDFVDFPSIMRDRWHLVDNQPAHVLLVIAQPR
ncbi:XRE family transcriptional regulator [Nocardia sp. NBC_01503]|uniref:helix-turn-helix domain-containing protein n=1 Tax=Nocardia sp. NBC_01503 TaxID=2975997 RepID=UPI002E7BB26D|nr:XRE family transcriptional regulator [Nocardia sp. NBC_01503]WTL35414.1 XRE family transcriptional regulator [Nocardia sp. NBC_01503]